MKKDFLINVGISVFLIFIFFCLPVIISLVLKFKTIPFFAGLVIEFIIWFIFFIWFIVQMNKKMENEENAENSK